MATHLFVLGAPNDDLGNLSAVATARVALAAALYRLEPDLVVVTTGGHGPQFNEAPLPHRDYANLALERLGVPPRALITDGFQSSNTVEDIAMIAEFAERERLTEVRMVTSAFHCARSRLIFGCLSPGTPTRFHAAADPPDLDPSIVAHERKATAAILSRGCVYWRGQTFTLAGRGAAN